MPAGGCMKSFHFKTKSRNRRNQNRWSPAPWLPPLLEQESKEEKLSSKSSLQGLVSGWAAATKTDISFAPGDSWLCFLHMWESQLALHTHRSKVKSLWTWGKHLSPGHHRKVAMHVASGCSQLKPTDRVRPKVLAQNPTRVYPSIDLRRGEIKGHFLFLWTHVFLNCSFPVTLVPVVN